MLSIGSLAWVGGATLQARTENREGRRRPAQILSGHLVLALGIGSVAVVLLGTSWSIALAAVGWALAGLGMGLSYNVTTATTLDHASRGNDGSVSSALQIAQTLGTALVAGLGTAVLAHNPLHPAYGFAVLFGIALIAVLVAFGAARRTTY